MVYAYPTNTAFTIDKNKIVTKRRKSKEAEAIKEFCSTHDISIIKDKNGKLVANVTEIIQ